jgi:hypothetical protein
MRTIATTICLLIYAAPAAAFEVNPGKWEITSTTKSAMMAQPQTKTSTECIEEKTAKEVLGALTEKDICKIQSHSEKGNTLEWTMVCQQAQSPPMNGAGKITSSGETLDGSMNISMKMGEQEMKFETTWKGKRVGECP